MRRVRAKLLRQMAFVKWNSLSVELKKINPFKSFLRRVKRSYKYGELKVA